MAKNLPDIINELQARIAQMEAKFSEAGYINKALVTSEMKTSWQIPAQADTYFGIHTAICCDTVDPWKQNRVRYFSPLFHDPEKVQVDQLPWAYPISSMGGFDDCGLNWVPPAGSKLCLAFDGGNKKFAFYLGTTWDRDRGPDGQHLWNYPVEEYYKIHEGKRKGYYVGRNDGSQVFPPWNTENYNGLDIDSIKDFEEDTEAITKITYPNIYGFKTPQKHMLKMVDGNYKCNHRWTRVELQSAGGGTLIFKDDHLHPSGQWLHPDCACGGGDVSLCNDEDGNPLEKADCPPDGDDSQCANPYHKHESECKPYKGVGTPQNNRINLPQSGFQMISPSGHTFIADDSVEQPQGIPDWERGKSPFDFGCTDKFEGSTSWISATGHKIKLNDFEESSNLRGNENGIQILTASGNEIFLNDHTISCPPNGSAQAGEERGIHLRSTSNHTFDMSDVDNLQCQNRREGGTPSSTANNAFVRTRTGYGLEIMMADYHTQEQTTERQFIQLYAPQYTACCGPHIIRMQEDPNCGQIFVRAGGDYVCLTEGDHYTTVGAGKGDACNGGCLGKKNKIVIVSKHTLHKSCNFYFNTAEVHAFLADRVILLLAGGSDYPNSSGGCGPGAFPVLVLQGSRIVASDRVFASASPNASCASMFQLLPFTLPCEPLGGC